MVAQYQDQFIEMAMSYVPKLALAIVTLIGGLWVIHLLVKGLKKILEKKQVDEAVQPFLATLASTSLKVILFVIVASQVGIATTSLVAVLGAAGLAIGLALQGSLANFAGGVLILLLKPFDTGHYIAASGYAGTVSEIQIFYTILVTPQNQRIMIPNGQLSNNPVINYSYEPTRRLDLFFGISYNDDIDLARQTIQEVINNDERTHKEPAPQILVEELADNSVTIKIRVWTDQDVFWPLHFDMIENVKKAFDKKGITIPFPQRDVHLHQTQNAG
jgi:small conductance mechanosensitive channel